MRDFILGYLTVERFSLFDFFMSKVKLVWLVLARAGFEWRVNLEQMDLLRV